MSDLHEQGVRLLAKFLINSFHCFRTSDRTVLAYLDSTSSISSTRKISDKIELAIGSYIDSVYAAGLNDREEGNTMSLGRYECTWFFSLHIPHYMCVVLYIAINSSFA